MESSPVETSCLAPTPSLLLDGQLAAVPVLKAAVWEVAPDSNGDLLLSQLLWTPSPQTKRSCTAPRGAGYQPPTRTNANSGAMQTRHPITGSVSIKSTATGHAPPRAHHHHRRHAHTQTQKHAQRSSKPSPPHSNSTHLVCNHERVRLADQLHHDRGAHGDLLGTGAQHPRPLVLGHVPGGDALDIWSARGRRPMERGGKRNKQRK